MSTFVHDRLDPERFMLVGVDMREYVQIMIDDPSGRLDLATGKRDADGNVIPGTCRVKKIFTGEYRRGEVTPLYNIGELAKFFFGMSPHWVRWQEGNIRDGRPNRLVLDGQPLLTRRTKGKIRIYDLADVELMAHALAQQGVIQGGKLDKILLLVHTEARLYEHID